MPLDIRLGGEPAWPRFRCRPHVEAGETNVLALPSLRPSQELIMPTLSRASTCLTVALLSVSVACNKGEAPKTTSLSQGAAAPGGELPTGHPDISATPNPIPAAGKVYLDSGNVAFRAKQFDVARKYYEKAASLAPDHGAPWFGIYMVGEATKDKKLADRALAEVKKRTPQDATPTTPPGKADSMMLNPHATPLPKS